MNNFELLLNELKKSNYISYFTTIEKLIDELNSLLTNPKYELSKNEINNLINHLSLKKNELLILFNEKTDLRVNKNIYYIQNVLKLVELEQKII